MDNKELIEQAVKVRENSKCDYTKYSVGAALLSKQGKIYFGTNVESKISGLGICAERAAIVNAISNGEIDDFEKIAIVGGKKGENIDSTLIPCGACLQFLIEFAENISIICYINGQLVERKINDFLKKI